MNSNLEIFTSVLIKTVTGTQTYFVILVIFGSYFMVNVFVATISGVFLRVRKEHQVRCAWKVLSHALLASQKIVDNISHERDKKSTNFDY